MPSDLDMLCDKTRRWKKTWEAEIHKRRYHRTRYAEKWMEGMAQSNLTKTKTHKNKNSAQKMAQAIYSWELFWCCWMSFPSPGDLPNPGIKPRSPTLQADSLPSEPPGKPQSQIPVLIKRNQSSLEEWMIPVQGQEIDEPGISYGIRNQRNDQKTPGITSKELSVSHPLVKKWGQFEHQKEQR